MTQAAVSYQVKLLEERLGAALFVREKGRAKLTGLMLGSARRWKDLLVARLEAGAA